MTDLGSRVVQEQVGGKEDLKPDNTHSALNAVLNAINNKFEYECLDEAVRLQNNIPRSMGDKLEWDVLQRQNSVPCSISEIQSTPLQRHPALTSVVEPIQVMALPVVVETLSVSLKV
jgi:hypothetical protein